MLACDPRRQLNLDFYPTVHHLPSPSPSHSHLDFFHGLPTTTCTPSPSDFNAKSLNYFQPSPATSDFQSLDSAESQYMSGSFSDHPAIRIEQPTPTPALPLAAGYPQHPTPVDSSTYTWGTLSEGNAQMVATATPSLQTAVFNRKSQSHQRAASSSSMASSGSSSPFSHGHATSFPYEMPGQQSSSKLSHSYNLDGSRTFGNHLPTPTQTPTQDSFLSSSYPSGNNFQHNQSIDSATAASMAMNRIMMETAGEEDVPGMSHSGRHSVSSIGQEPTTPHTLGSDYDVGLRVPSNGEIDFKVDDWLDTYLQYDDEADNLPHQSVPKMDRTMTDVYADEGYYPSAATSIPVTNAAPIRQSTAFLSPHQSRVREFLQAAQIARSQSPTSAASREISPFRSDSPWAAAVRMQSAAQTRESQKAQSLRNELDQHMSSPQTDSTPKTISPKDAVLDYHPDDEDAKVPLFPDASAMQNSYNSPPQQNLGSMNASGAGNWPSGPSRQAPTANFSAGPLASTHQHSAFHFTSPSGPNFPQGAVSFPTTNYRASSMMASTKQEETPDFPAHLTSMESSASEAAAPPSNTTSQANMHNFDAQKPSNTSTLADTGTYTCTYHGCSLRFETPQKLQRHKREGHRQVTAQQQHTPGVGSGMTSAALAARNSQSGPHKCDRINPTTGKSCNTVFSRPYDLTRHEDTIHNARKQKVRCALCVEEKTFSRNDALTRHMRVVHPEVDFPGKHRRRGAHD